MSSRSPKRDHVNAFVENTCRVAFQLIYIVDRYAGFDVLELKR